MPPKKTPERDVIRMAVRLQERLQEFRKSVRLGLPETKWLECQRLARLTEKALQRGWLAAAQRIRPRFERAVQDFQQSLSRSLTEDKQQQQLPSCPSFRELYTELVALFDEFGPVEYNLRQRTFSVMTDAITLEDVSLGSFRIELALGSTEERLQYEVIAIDPNLPAKDEEVSHPHVRNSTLYEGEGMVPIRRALEEGRLCDFFQIVIQILQTYNPGSAYVPLDEWEGLSCIACGASLYDDEQTSCSRTGDPLCYECAVNCPGCECNFSPELLERCQHCDEDHCDRCLEQGICHACQERIHPEEETEASRAETETPSGGRGGHCSDVDQTETLDAAI